MTQKLTIGASSIAFLLFVWCGPFASAQFVENIHTGSCSTHQSITSGWSLGTPGFNSGVSITDGLVFNSMTTYSATQGNSSIAINNVSSVVPVVIGGNDDNCPRTLTISGGSIWPIALVGPRIIIGRGTSDAFAGQAKLRVMGTGEVILASHIVILARGASTASGELEILAGGEVHSTTISFGDFAATDGIATFTMTGGTLRTNRFNVVNSVGANSSINFNGGTLKVASTGGSVTLLSPNAPTTNIDGNFTIDTFSSTAKIDKSMGGTGSLTKIGNGRLELLQDNFYQGTTTVEPGQNAAIWIGNGGTSGSFGLGDVINNAEIRFDRSDTHVVQNNISGTGLLVHDGDGGTLILAGNNTYTGVTAVLSGATLQLDSDLQSNTVLVGSTFGGATLRGNSEIAGHVDLRDGEVTGNFTILGDLLNDRGTISPGESAGMMTIGGNLSLSRSSDYDVELGGLDSSEYDSLKVMSDAELEGGVNVSLINGFSLDAGMTFEIIDVDGILSGEFFNLGEGDIVASFGNVAVRVSYVGGDGNDVALYTTHEPTLPDSFKLADGVLVSGQLSDLFASDDLRFEVDPSPTKNLLKQRIDLIVQSTSPTLTPTDFSFQVESRMSGGPSGDVIQTVELFNYVTNTRELVDSRAVANSDELIEITPGGDLSRFVNQINGEITAIVIWKSESFSGAQFTWSIDVDQAVWSVMD